MIDSHIHINSKVTKTPEREKCRITYNQQIKKVINVGLDIPTSKECVISAKRNPKIYCSVGIHPLYTDNQDYNELYEIAESNKVVAIGEIGLDKQKENFEEQKRYLIEQIIIANALKMPVIIHSNNSNQEIVKIFETIVKPQYGCVFHCYQPDLKILKYIINNGFYISFAGRVTYKNADKSIKVAKAIPDELFLVETDSPYISPEPVREEVNNVNNLHYIVSRLAQIKEKTFAEIEKQTEENTLRLFKKMK